MIGFDDSPAAIISRPALTTLRQSAQEIGRTAALYLERLIAGAVPADCQARLPVELVVGETTGERGPHPRPLPRRNGRGESE